jgi:hypothetical protein
MPRFIGPDYQAQQPSAQYRELYRRLFRGMRGIYELPQDIADQIARFASNVIYFKRVLLERISTNASDRRIL